MRTLLLFLCALQSSLIAGYFSNRDCTIRRGLRTFECYAEYLVFRPIPTGLDYTVINNTDLATILQGPLKSLNPDLRSGFRVGLFSQIPCWFCSQYGIEFAHFDANKSASKEVDPNPIFLDATRMLAVFAPDRFSQADAVYRVNFNDLDLSIGYPFSVPLVQIYLNPRVGLRYSNLNQQIDAEYLAVGGGGGLRTSAEEVKMHAGGLFAGINTRFSFCLCKLGLFARGKAALMYGYFRGTSVFINELTPDTPVYDIKFSRSQLVPAYEIAAGLDMRLCRTGGLSFFAQLGYELQSWRVADFHYPANVENTAVNRNQMLFNFGGLVARLQIAY